MTTPSEAVRVAVQECKRLAEDFAYENAMGAVYKTSAGRTDKRRAKLHAAIDALAALSLHVGDASDGQSDALGASASPTACSGPSAPEPQSVSALRVPPAGAGGESERWVSVERMLPECDVRVLVYEERDGTVCLDWLVADEQGEPNYWQNLGYGPYTFVTHWMPLPAPPEAQAIVTREGGDPSWAPSPKAIERGPEGMRPEEGRAQPFPGERHALPRLQVPVDEGLDANERDGKRQETPLADLREVPEDQRPAAPSSAQEQAGVAAQPSPHIEPELEYPPSSEGTVRCTCDAYPHLYGCGSVIGQRGWEAGFKYAQALATTPTEGPALTLTVDELRGLDTPTRVRFYEHDFYPLSNFSAFTLYWRGLRFDTSEAAYHFEKFPDWPEIRAYIKNAPSAHEAFKHAEANKMARRPDWADVKVDIMRDILRAKAEQHEYVRRKLLATCDRELVEDSWRDDFWGWGPNRDGKNMLGRLWMEVRAELRASTLTDPEGAS